MSDGTFLAYIALLAVSGVILLVLGIGGFGQTVGARLLDVLFGVGFLGYGVYLLLFFEGGRVRIFFYAFVVPVLAIGNAVKSWKARREQSALAGPAPFAAQPGADAASQSPKPGAS